LARGSSGWACRRSCTSRRGCRRARAARRRSSGHVRSRSGPLIRAAGV
jgi:hypothetical protein